MAKRPRAQKPHPTAPTREWPLFRSLAAYRPEYLTGDLVALLGCASSSIYYLLCLWSAASFLRARKVVRSSGWPQSLPPVSILKPLKGVDPEIYEGFRSHCLQDYPEYEIIFGVSDPADPAVASVEQLQREFPARAIRLVVCSNILGTNVKVSNLEQMMQHGRAPRHSTR